MKRIIIALYLSIFSFGFSNAQDTLHVSQEDKLMSKGTHTAFVVDIPQARVKDVVSAWKKYIKRGETKSSVESNDDNEFQIIGTQIVNISPQPMNVYALIKEAEKAVRLTAFFTEDDSVFVSSKVSEEKAQAASMLMKDFARAQYRLAVERELDNENKELKKLENEKGDLINAVEKSNKNINEYERKIDRAKTDIETNSTEQSKLRAEAANQKEVVRSTTPKTETYDLEEKKLNALEKELKKSEKQGENLHSDIDGWNSDIRSEKRNIEKNEDQEKEKKESISKQKDHVKQVKEKMENIR